MKNNKTIETLETISILMNLYNSLKINKSSNLKSKVENKLLELIDTL